MAFAISSDTLRQLEGILGRELAGEVGKREAYTYLTPHDIDDLRSLGCWPIGQVSLVLHWMAGAHGLQNAKMFVYEVLHERMELNDWCSTRFIPR